MPEESAMKATVVIALDLNAQCFGDPQQVHLR